MEPEPRFVRGVKVRQSIDDVTQFGDDRLIFRSGVALPLDQRETVAGDTETILAMSLPCSPPSSFSRSSILLTAVPISTPKLHIDYTT